MPLPKPGIHLHWRNRAGLALPSWISPADLMHMRIGDVSAFKPETQLQYVGHLKPGIYIKAGRFVGLTQ